jgi:hypothetical protein
MTHFIRLNLNFVESFEGVKIIIQSMMNFIDRSKLTMAYLLDHREVLHLDQTVVLSDMFHSLDVNLLDLLFRVNNLVHVFDRS